jgi:hypothetical protein
MSASLAGLGVKVFVSLSLSLSLAAVLQLRLSFVCNLAVEGPQFVVASTAAIYLGPAAPLVGVAVRSPERHRGLPLLQV